MDWQLGYLYSLGTGFLCLLFHPLPYSLFSEERKATVIFLHSEERQFAKEKRKMKNLGANFALPLHSKVKKKKNQLLLLCLLLKKSQRTKIFHLNCYSKINCDPFFQIDSELQISIRIKVVTK